MSSASSRTEEGTGVAENQERRRARRQKRGLLRVEEFLHAAGALFAEVGYDKTTTNMIAERAGASPGSLYQFFPNKEAIARAYAEDAVAHLHRVYDGLLAPPTIDLPLPAFVETFVDRLLDFNREHPGYFALGLASTISAPLAQALADLQGGVFERIDALLAAFWPGSTPEQRRLPGLVSQRVFVAILPLALGNDGERQQAIVRELKAVLYRYVAPMLQDAVAPAPAVAGDAPHDSPASTDAGERKTLDERGADGDATSG